jgi:hypothetical protein
VYTLKANLSMMTNKWQPIIKASYIKVWLSQSKSRGILIHNEPLEKHQEKPGGEGWTYSHRQE